MVGGWSFMETGSPRAPRKAEMVFRLCRLPSPSEWTHKELQMLQSSANHKVLEELSGPGSVCGEEGPTHPNRHLSMFFSGDAA